MRFSLQTGESYRLKDLFHGYSNTERSLDLTGTSLSFTGRNANVN